MRITHIKAAIKTPGRFNVFVDGVYAFSLDESQLLASGVRVGKDYSSEQVAAFKEESAFGKAYARALDYILRRVRSEKEMRDYAQRKQWSRVLAERVLAALKARGHLDDTAFAEAWVRWRALGKPISQRKLWLELKQKGVSEEIIQEVLNKNETFNELDSLRRLVAKKRAHYNDKQKLMAYLARLGFRFGDVQAVLEEEL